MILKALFPALLAAATAFTAALAAAEPASPDGAQIFNQRCHACHAVEAGQPSLIAPNLHGVVGRKAGTVEFRYSPALKDSGITWTGERLDEFLTGPSKLVPGTRMVVSIPDPVQRKAVIAYLAQHGG